MTKKYPYVHRFLLLLTCVIGMMTISACGQKGPLYLPKNASTDGITTERNG